MESYLPLVNWQRIFWIYMWFLCLVLSVPHNQCYCWCEKTTTSEYRQYRLFLFVTKYACDGWTDEQNFDPISDFHEHRAAKIVQSLLHGRYHCRWIIFCYIVVVKRKWRSVYYIWDFVRVFHSANNTKFWLQANVGPDREAKHIQLSWWEEQHLQFKLVCVTSFCTDHVMKTKWQCLHFVCQHCITSYKFRYCLQMVSKLPSCACN